MSLGIFMKGLNSLYFKKYLDFFFEFIPQIIFMLGLFGYMNFMIIRLHELHDHLQMADLLS